MLSIEIWQEKLRWCWAVSDIHHPDDDGSVVYGSAPDYKEACGLAHVAWEQMMKDRK